MEIFEHVLIALLLALVGHNSFNPTVLNAPKTRVVYVNVFLPQQQRQQNPSSVNQSEIVKLNTKGGKVVFDGENSCFFCGGGG